MRTLIIDRIEGIYAICRDKDMKPHKNAKEQRFYALQLSDLPSDAAAGDTVSVDDEVGTLSLEKSRADSKAVKK